MSFRSPPSAASLAARAAALGAIDAEILSEQASALGRAGRRLEAALADIASFDTGAPQKRGRRGPAPDRSELVAEARQALWRLIVQREACGFRNSEDVLAAYRVPAELSRGVTHTPVVWRRRR